MSKGDGVEEREGDDAQYWQSSCNDQDEGNGVRLHRDCIDGCEHASTQTHHGLQDSCIDAAETKSAVKALSENGNDHEMLPRMGIALSILAFKRG